MVFFAFNHPVPDDPSPGSITLYLNARGSWSGTLYQPAGRFGSQVQSQADHEALVDFFAPEGFPREWIPEMAQQMVEAQPNRWGNREGTAGGGGGRPGAAAAGGGGQPDGIRLARSR
jgi:hypothetical protein